MMILNVLWCKFVTFKAQKVVANENFNTSFGKQINKVRTLQNADEFTTCSPLKSCTSTHDLFTYQLTPQRALSPTGGKDKMKTIRVPVFLRELLQCKHVGRTALGSVHLILTCVQDSHRHSHCGDQSS